MRKSTLMGGVLALGLASSLLPCAALAQTEGSESVAGDSGYSSESGKVQGAQQEEAVDFAGTSTSEAEQEIAEVADSEITSQPSEEAMSDAMSALEAATPSALSLQPLDGTRSSSALVQEFSGADRYEVSQMVAKAAFPNGCSTAIIAGGEGWADALGATSLAGALDCPILLTEWGSLSGVTKEALSSLGVTSVIIVGGPDTVSPSVESDLAKANIKVSMRIGGADRYAVQMGIYNYGKERGLWGSDYVIVASGVAFGDALSASPLAYSKKAPVFLVNEDGALSDVQKSALKGLTESGKGRTRLVVGGPRSVSDGTVSELQKMVSSSSDGGTLRLGGADRYEVSANFADWAVKNGLLKWDGAAFTTGEKPFDALTGSSLQGKAGSVMLLLDGGSSPTVQKFVASGSNSVKFFGGTSSVPSGWRSEIIEQMYSVGTYDMGVSLSEMASLESKTGLKYSTTEILEYLDPANFSYGSSGFYQFADVSRGYSGRVTAEQIDSFIESVCERNGFSSSKLLGMGSTIVDAARTYGVNEVYLMAHAILESGWGTSALSQGTVKGYEGYYNFFGIGAWDADPNNGGAYLAKSKGWDTPQKAIAGAAQWISANYIRSSYGQNTLYKMRWNSSVMWHQYATDRMWANNIARVMGQAYDYFGLDVAETGLSFLYPSYR